MNSRKTIWGIFLILLGGILVVNNFGLLSVDIDWARAGSLWPLILIIMGLNSLAKNTSINPWVFNGLMAVTMVVFVFQVIDFDGNVDRKWDNGIEKFDDKGLSNQHFDLPLDSNVRIANLEFDGGAASFVIADTTSQLFVAKSSTKRGEYQLEKIQNDSIENIKMKLNKTKFQYKDGKWDNHVDINLNPNLIWNLDFEVGAGAVDFDLSKFVVRKLNINAGAAAVDIKLSDLSKETSIDVDAGASSIHLKIPSNARCRVKMDAVLSSKKLEGFTKGKDDIYESDNFKSGGNLVNITIDAGMSDVTVSRY